MNADDARALLRQAKERRVKERADDAAKLRLRLEERFREAIKKDERTEVQMTLEGEELVINTMLQGLQDDGFRAQKSHSNTYNHWFVTVAFDEDPQ